MRIRPPSTRPTGSRREGAVAVEFFVVLPILVTLVLGCIDFGFFAYNYVQVANAAHVAAVHGSMTPFLPSERAAWDAKLTEVARDEMFSRLDPRRTRLTVRTPAVTTEPPTNGMRTVGVVVSYEFRTIINWGFIPNSVHVTGASVLRAMR